MENYNPTTDKTLLSTFASNSQIEHLEFIKNKVISHNNVKFLDVEIGNKVEPFIIRLISNYQNLNTFWKLNFIESSTKKQPNGTIYFLNTNMVSDILNYERFKYYIPHKNEAISLNNDFYGNLKVTYRGLCANIGLYKNIISLHSAAVKLNTKTVLITGVSGSGKSTIYKYLIRSLKGSFVWDDWGFIDPNSLSIIIPNEIHNHMKIKSLKFLLPFFNDFSDKYTEFYDKNNMFFDSARIMINLRDYIPNVSSSTEKLKLDTLILLSNDINQNHFIKRIDNKEAKKLFFTPIYSKAYESKVHYFDGSLFLNDFLKDKHEILYSLLLDNLKDIIHINNNFTDINFQKLETFL